MDNRKYFLQDTESVEPFLKEGWAQVIIIKYWWWTSQEAGRGVFERHFKGPITFSLIKQVMETEIWKDDLADRKGSPEAFDITDIIYGPQEKII